MTKTEKKILAKQLIDLLDDKRFFLAIFQDRHYPMVISNGNTDDIQKMKKLVDNKLDYYYKPKFEF
jgi:hypothetical protein